MKKVIVLDNIRSVLNVGSIFRTANGLGVDEVILCGITPTPLDKKGEKRKDFAKVALGSEESISWRYNEHARDIVKEYKKAGFHIFALEQDARSLDYKKVQSEENIVLIVGSEVDGVQKELLEYADTIIEIPMLGLKESLNVTIAFGIAGYKLFDNL
jgi:tRNA G18 (ribose-2'-O)-methylase SpoU